MGVSLSFLPCTLIHPTVKGRGVENPWAPPWGTHPSVGCSAPPSQRVSLGCPGRLLFADSLGENQGHPGVTVIVAVTGLPHS